MNGADLGDRLNSLDQLMRSIVHNYMFTDPLTIASVSSTVITWSPGHITVIMDPFGQTLRQCYQRGPDDTSTSIPSVCIQLSRLLIVYVTISWNIVLFMSHGH
jgi:hypothetical protein